MTQPEPTPSAVPSETASATAPATGRGKPGAGAIGSAEALATVDVTGPDAESFLQGQLTNDLGLLGAGGVQLQGWCSAKGRLLAALIVHRLPDGFRLVLPGELAAPFVQRLGMFVLRAAVSVVRREDLGALAAFLPDAAAADPALAALGLELAGLPPEGPAAVLGEDGSSVLRWHPVHGEAERDAVATRLLAIVPLAGVGETLRSADASLARLSPDEVDAAWRLGDVRAGIASVRGATREAFVPQMVNFGEAGGLSFKKGCYPGQEIVARMQYLGKLKKHMRRFRTDVAGADLPVPGAHVAGLSPDGARTEGAGEIVDAVRVGDALELLAVVRIDAEGLRLDVGGEPAYERPLPYALPGGGEARGRRTAEDVS